jgi:hypothetical protein
MRTHGPINLIIEELNANYTYARLKHIEIIVIKFSLVPRQRIIRPNWD